MYPQGLFVVDFHLTERMNKLTVHIDRQRSCVNDTLPYYDSITDAFHRACKLLDICGNNGLLLTPKCHPGPPPANGHHRQPTSDCDDSFLSCTCPLSRIHCVHLHIVYV